MDNTSKINLRQKAEAQFEKDFLQPDSHLSEGETQRLIHELQVHQIELEMQNSEIIESKLQVELASVKYSELYDFAPSGYFTLSKTGEILELNLSGSQLLGKSRLKLRNSCLGFFLTENTKPIFNLFLAELFNSKAKTFCEVAFSVNGSTIEVLLTGIRTESELQCLVTTVDITKLKQAERELRKSQLLLSSSIESQKDTMLLSVDCNYCYLYFNKAHHQSMLEGYHKDIKLGMNVLDCITSDDDRQAARENYSRALKGESHSNVRRYGMTELVWFESFFNPIVNEQNEIIGATGLARNINDRIANEVALAESRELYSELVSNQSVGIYRINVPNPENGKSILRSSTLEFVSDRFCDLFEIRRSDFSDNPIELLAGRIHPDDLPEFIKSNEEAQKSLETYIWELRLLIENRIKWIRFESCPHKLDDESMRWTGVVIDITLQKLIESDLKRKIGELEIYYELAITRERKMIALKSEINLLLERLGEKPKY